MTSKDLKKQSINNALSQIPDTWQLDDKSKELQSLYSLFNYLVQLKQDKPIPSTYSDLEPQEIPYNASPFHFFLYYTYYPKYPFVTYKEDTFIFGDFSGKRYNILELSFPLMSNATSALMHLNKFLSSPLIYSLLKENNIKKIILRDVDDNFINILRRDNEKFIFKLQSLKELNYATYNVNKTLKLVGDKFANLRWHLNSFKKAGHTIEVVTLNKAVKQVIHLIGKWYSNALKHRGFSYINMRSDKLGARLFGFDNNTFSFQKKDEIISLDNVVSRVLKLDGHVAAFNLGYPLGIFKKQKVFAHAIGISDVSIPHLAEYAQYDFWKQVKKNGYCYINDGPTWKDKLETYKDKFRPIAKKRYYWATFLVNSVK